MNEGFMKRFGRCRSVCALVFTLGLTISSCVTQEKNPTFVSLQSSPLTTTVPDVTTKTAVQTAYGKLPLSFEANQGQADPKVKFLSRGRGYHLLLAPTEAIITVQPPRGKKESEKRRSREKG